jgi:hypothetical protein
MRRRSLDGNGLGASSTTAPSTRYQRANNYLNTLDLLMTEEIVQEEDQENSIPTTAKENDSFNGNCSVVIGSKQTPSESSQVVRKVGDKDKRSENLEDHRGESKIPRSDSRTREYCSQMRSQDKEQPGIGTVCVIVRGDITNKMFDIWKRKLVEVRKSLSVTSSFDPGASCIVVPSNMPTVEILENWSQRDMQEVLSKPFVSKEWVIDCLKQRRLLDINEYAVIERPATSAKRASELEESSVNADIAMAQNGEESQATLQPTNSASDANSSILVDSDGETAVTNDFNVENDVPTAPTDAQQNRNQHITEVFDKLAEMYDLTGDGFRAKVYKQACGMLSSMPHISDVSQVKGVRGIGKSLLDKIDEILETGHLKKLDSFNQNPQVVAVTELCKVHGIGLKTATVLMKKHGFMSVDELEKRGMQYLTPPQQIGVKWFREFQIPVPRSETQQIEAIVSEYANRYVTNIVDIFAAHGYCSSL